MSAALHEHVDDSVPLDALSDGPRAASPCLRAGSLKPILALFLSFMLVVSDVFTHSVIAGFGENAVKGRAPTSWGVVLQGISLVILYAVAAHLIGAGVL